jgi:molybdate transport system ATP-binding protein
MLIDLHIEKTLTSRKRVFHLDMTLKSDCPRIVIYGESGAGKTMTLRAIAGLARPDKGYIRLNDRALFDSEKKIDLKPQHRRVAFLFQDYALFPHLTVRQNIAFAATRGIFNPRVGVENDEVDHWLEAFHLTPLAYQYPDEISGGQRQRVALARALLVRPSALLLDEPFSALDPDLRQHMREELSELQTRIDVPMILITHDSQDVKYFGQEVVEVENGKIKDKR